MNKTVIALGALVCLMSAANMINKGMIVWPIVFLGMTLVCLYVAKDKA